MLKDDLTGAEILTELNKFKDKLKPGDTLVFFFSGHGSTVKDNDKDEQLPDAKTEDDEVMVGKNNTFVTDDQLAEKLKEIAVDSVTTMVILDSCASGGMWGGKGDLNTVKNIYLLASIDEVTLRCGLFDFTKVLSEGLKGDADSNNDGKITMEEIFKYIDDKHEQGEKPILFKSVDEKHERPIAIVPEPSTLLLIGSGLAGIFVFGRKGLFKKA